MKWKLSLFGYRERDVNAYIQELVEANAAEIAAIEESIGLATEIRLRQSMQLTSLCEERDRRRARIDEAKTALIRVYYQTLHREYYRAEANTIAETYTKVNDKEMAAPNAGGKKSGQRMIKRMRRQTLVGTSIPGVSQKALEAHLYEMEKMHERAIGDLKDKLEQLEKAIATQRDEIKGLEDLMQQPEMQERFIDLSERFLARFEKMIDEAMRKSGGMSSPGVMNKREMDARERERELRLQIARYRRLIKSMSRASVSTEEQEAENGRMSRLAGQSSNDRSQFTELDEYQLGPLARADDDLATGSSGSAESARPGNEAPGEHTGADSHGEKGLKELRFLYLLEKKAGAELFDQTGEVLIRSGEPISLETAEKIFREGLMDQLIKYLQ